jgi:hypothetical protein
MVLYTMDLICGRIQKGAVIQIAEDLQQLETVARDAARGTPLKLGRWVPGTFTECWIELPARPRGSRCSCLKCVTSAVHQGIPCRVQPPGFHPGGSTWRLTPKAAVLVPVWRQEFAEEQANG